MKTGPQTCREARGQFLGCKRPRPSTPPGLFLLEKRRLWGSCMELGWILFCVEQTQDH